MAMTIVNPSGSHVVDNPVLVGGVTWDNTACNPLTGRCPTILVPPVYSGSPGYNLVLGGSGVSGNTVHLYPVDHSKLVSGGNSSVGVELIGRNLTALAVSGQPGQGSCVSPVYAQQAVKVAEGVIQLFYWEITWSALANNTLAGGIGVCDVSVIGQWQNVAATGAASLILRPSGDVFLGGQQVIPSPPPFGHGTTNWLPAQSAGDTIGFAMTMENNGLAMQIYGVGGSVAFSSAGDFHLSPDANPAFPGDVVGSLIALVPCVAFGTATINDYAVTANFGAGGANSFLGVQNGTFQKGENGLIFGWPNLP